jgi:polyribonucleotide nucleotidyltransferase
MGVTTVQAMAGNVAIEIQTGRIAKQAAGSVTVRMGDTVVLVTACEGPGREGIDFFPLTVEYIAKTYAAGKIPGGFFKREGKPSEKEILSARLVDRPLRPMFASGYRKEVQIIATVVSADETYDADVLAIIGASAALSISHMPFMEPVAAVRVGMVDGQFKVFTTIEETDKGALDMIVAGSADSIVMVEGGVFELSEEKLVEAIMLAHEEIKKLVAIQKDLVAQIGKPKVATPEIPPVSPEIKEAVRTIIGDRLHDISFCGIKGERYAAIDALRAEAVTQLAERFPENSKDISEAFNELEVEDMRSTILDKGVRIGGRALDGIRPISCEMDILPRTHGSALFTRGETQALAIATLGSKLDEQKIDYIQGGYYKSYMLHYNFPPYSVGECKRVGSVSRREVGHGHLAERGLAPILPDEASFPYTIRLVSEILESNGSSSMASVCGCSLALMAAGVPTKCHVAGVAMGLIKDGDKVAVLTDILGTEDHLGDMDFKVTGTRAGVTAIQMDIKIRGITAELMKDALDKARIARLKILDIMDEALPKPRTELSALAPRIMTMNIDRDKIRDIIGPGGKVIRQIQEDTGATINVSDDGTILLVGPSKKEAENARALINGIVAEPEIDSVYTATVKTVVEFGAFAEFLPGREGLIHISELEHRRVAKVDDVVQVGDKVEVKVIGFDRNGKIRLSRKALLPQSDEE